MANPTALAWLDDAARVHGWTREVTDQHRWLYTHKDMDALLEVRYDHRGRVLDAIYYNRDANCDQYVMFDEKAKKETIEWILRAKPFNLLQQPRRGPLHYNTTPNWKKAKTK